VGILRLNAPQLPDNPHDKAIQMKNSTGIPVSELQNATILVVDDEEWNRKLLKSMLSRTGYQVVVAGDGKEALDRMDKTKPDAVLLDLIMPGMDGFETTQLIKKDARFQHIPIIVVTADKDEDSRIRVLQMGADDFLTKPVNRSELVVRLENHLKLKRYHDRLLYHQTELEEKVAARTKELKQSFDTIKKASLETIFRLTRAAEYRDEDTGDHIQRMSRMAEAVARQMKLSEELTEQILYATPLHDIGKIGIPDRILLKPGKLAPDEWEIMKTHTVLGAKILEGSSINFLRLAEVIAMTHHERWDGTGYPRGLERDSIPLVGRIVAIVDVFDALASKRPYKKPFTLERSLSIIRESIGTHFDPAVVEAFFSVQDEISDIQHRYNQDSVSHLFNLADFQ
jgi:putative two-component system response regulator